MTHDDLSLKKQADYLVQKARKSEDLFERQSLLSQARDKYQEAGFPGMVQWVGRFIKKVEGESDRQYHRMMDRKHWVG